MKFILGLLSGGFGSWILGGVGVLVAGSLALAGVQGWRLDRVKRELTLAKAGLTDPATRRPWRELAFDRQLNLDTCKANLDGATRDLAALAEAARAKSAEDAATLARTTQALSAARKSNALLDQLVDGLKVPLPAGEACARVLAFDDLVLQGLRGQQ
jgi:hypothetical protein